MSLREWLRRFWARQRSERKIGETRQNPTNKDERLSELATLIESGDFNEASLNRLADLMGQTDPNRSRFE